MEAKPRGLFDGVTDRRYLRAAADVLDRLVQDLDDGATVTADARALAVRWRAGARARNKDLMLLGTPDPRPVVRDPAGLSAVSTVQGQPLVEVIDGTVSDTTQLCSAVVSMAPGHRAFAHVHPTTDVVVVVLEGAVETIWWDLPTGGRHVLPQRAGEHLHIPAGVPHAAINRGVVPVRAIEVRGNKDFRADNERLPWLDPEVTMLLPAVA